MKRSFRLLSLLLALIFVLSVSAVPALAKNKSKAASGKDYKTITVLGDSLSTGYMIQKSDGSYVDHTHGKRIKASFPSRVADAVNCTTYNNYSREGSGTNELIRLLDPNFVPDKYFREVSDAIVRKYFDGEENFAKLQKQVQKDLKQSDLIFLNCGSNDLFATVMTVIKHIQNGDSENGTSPYRRAILEKLDKTVSSYVAQGEIGKAWAAIFEVASILNLGTETVEALTECAARGYMNFQKNWGTLATLVHNANPKATVVVVSLFNGARGMGALPGTNVGIGAAMDPFFHGMNARIVSFNAVHNYYKYVDINGVETAEWPPLTEMLDLGKMYDYMMLCTHPTKNGHKWIAKKVLKVI